MSQTATNSQPELKHILEAVLLAAGEPVSLSRMATLFDAKDAPSASDLSKALDELAMDLQSRGIELKEVSSGFRLKTRAELMPWISRLWEEKPQRYSRALLETLSLIAYRQPITRGEIEEVRGVSVSSNIIRTLQEREWIRVVGHRDVPGKPALFGTTRAFLDYFDLSSLDDLPTLAEIRDMSNLEPEFDFDVSLPASPDADDDDPGVEGTAEAVVEIAPEVPADDEGDDSDFETDESTDDSDIEDEHERPL